MEYLEHAPVAIDREAYADLKTALTLQLHLSDADYADVDAAAAHLSRVVARVLTPAVPADHAASDTPAARVRPALVDAADAFDDLAGDAIRASHHETTNIRPQ